MSQFQAALQAALLIADDGARLRALHSLGITIDEAAYREATQAVAPFDTDALSDAVLARWAAADPRAAAEWAARLPPDGRDLSELTVDVALAWAETDSSAAAAFAAGLPDGPTRDRLLLCLRARTDPQLAATEVLRLPRGESRRRALAQLVGAMVREDLYAALQWVFALNSQADREEGLQVLVRALAEADPAAALKLAAALPPGTQRRELLDAIVSAVARTRPALAWELAGGLLRESDAARARYAVLRELAPRAPAAAARLVAALPEGYERTVGVRQVTFQWGKTDPRACLLWLLDSLNAAEQDAALSECVAGWSERSPYDAMHFMMSLHGKMTVPLTTWLKVVRTWTFQAPAQAAGFARGLPSEMDEKWRTGIAGEVAAAWAATDPAAACAWARTLEQPLRGAAIRRLAAELAGSDVRSALGLADELTDGRTRDEVLASIAERAAPHDPAAAAAVIERLAKVERFHIHEIAVHNWADRDPAAAAAWVRRIRDAGKFADTFVEKQLLADYAAAPDEARRQIERTLEASYVGTLGFIIERWARRDPDAAQRWIESSGLPAETRRSLHRSVRRSED